MSEKKFNEEILFEQALARVRETEPTTEEMQAAASRVWAKVADAAGSDVMPAVASEPHAVLSSESDYRALFVDYYDGQLSPSRQELLEARLRENVVTRQAWLDYKAGRDGRLTDIAAAKQRQEERIHKSRFSSLFVRWAAVAAMLVAVAGLSWYGWNAWGPAQTGPQATVYASNLPLYLVTGQGVHALKPGDAIGPRQQVRVPEGAEATIELRDGSRVELRDGSSFQLSSFGSDLTVELLGGDVIVEAAKRSQGHLYVSSRDLRVAVTGTVFTVGAGVKGSRVGVLEGSVLVAQAGRKRALKPGQQYSSSADVRAISLEEQISWSENFDRHLALLKSLTELDKELAAMQLPSLRYSSRLAGGIPADTMIYASVPNLESTIHQAREILNNRLQNDPVLSQWLGQGDGNVTVDTLLGELEGISRFTGDEILLTATRNAENKPDAPAIVAELKQQGFPEYLEQRIAALAGTNEPPPLHVYRTLAELAGAAAGQGVHLSVAGGFLVISPEIGTVRRVAGSLASGVDSGFLATDFGARVQSTYRDGAGFFLAADVTGLARREDGTVDKGAEFTGVDDLRFLEVEQQQVNGNSDLRSTFTFAENRKGLASWLAAPGALRALEFVSPGAVAASAAMVKDPVAMFEDLIRMASNSDDAEAKLAELEAKTNIRIREDLAQTLGNEVAFAIDGPVFPVPAWKLIVQVNDPVRLNTTIQRIIEAANREASLRGKPTAQYASETVDGLTYHTVTLPEGAKFTTVNYVFANGYLLMGPDRGLLRQALQTQASGVSLLTAGTFRELIPSDAYTGFSGVFFQQAAGAIGSIAKELAAASGENQERAQAMEQMARELKPTLVAAYAAPREVTVASRNGLFGLGGNSLVRMGMLMQLLESAKSGVN